MSARDVKILDSNTGNGVAARIVLFLVSRTPNGSAVSILTGSRTVEPLTIQESAKEQTGKAIVAINDIAVILIIFYSF